MRLSSLLCALLTLACAPMSDACCFFKCVKKAAPVRESNATTTLTITNVGGVNVSGTDSEILTAFAHDKDISVTVSGPCAIRVNLTLTDLGEINAKVAPKSKQFSDLKTTTAEVYGTACLYAKVLHGSTSSAPDILPNHRYTVQATSPSGLASQVVTFHTTAR